ncbi:hypothetical protein ACU4GG_37145 [Streptomyces nojiriensis]
MWANAAEAKAASRGQEYIQPGVHPAAKAPLGRSRARMDSRARSAAARCAGDLPGTRPAASQARLRSICRQASGSPAGTMTEAVRSEGTYRHRPDGSRSTLLRSTYRASLASGAVMPSTTVALARRPTVGAARSDSGA